MTFWEEKLSCFEFRNENKLWNCHFGVLGNCTNKMDRWGLLYTMKISWHRYSPKNWMRKHYVLPICSAVMTSFVTWPGTALISLFRYKTSRVSKSYEYWTTAGLGPAVIGLRCFFSDIQWFSSTLIQKQALSALTVALSSIRVRIRREHVWLVQILTDTKQMVTFILEAQRELILNMEVVNKNIHTGSNSAAVFCLVFRADKAVELAYLGGVGYSSGCGGGGVGTSATAVGPPTGQPITVYITR